MQSQLSRAQRAQIQLVLSDPVELSVLFLGPGSRRVRSERPWLNLFWCLYRLEAVGGRNGGWME